MPDLHHPLHRSIVALYDEAGEIVGVGFLAAPDLVCTCAHVVCDALHLDRKTIIQPTIEVSLAFPYLGETQNSAYLKAWIPMKQNDGGGDIAVLRLKGTPPAGARPARLLPASNLSGREFAAFGFPSAFDMGQNAYGVLHDRLANGWVEIQGTSPQGYRVQRGYSGAPVWDTYGRGVVGMVVAEDSDSEAKVAFLIPNDLIQLACSDIKLVTLNQLFQPLTEGLLGLPGSPLNGVEQFLLEYLGTPEKPAPFGGRHLHLADLDRWMGTPGQPYALLVAEAGRGKSALLAQWVATVAYEQSAKVVLVPVSIRFSTSLKSATWSLLGARLRYIHGVKADPPRDMEVWLAEIEGYLREDHPAPLLIVLDGADEAADWMIGRDLRFPPHPGRGIKVLVSVRSLANCDATGWLRRLEWQGLGTLIDLPLLDKSGLTEVLQSMGNPLARLATQVDVVGELYRLSEGDPLLVRLYVEALLGLGEQAAFLTPDGLRNLEPGLKGYFDQWWNDQRRQWGSSAPLKEPAVRILLNLLSCALGPLLTDDLLILMEPEQIDYWIFEEALRVLARFIKGDGQIQGYIFSHPRLNQYFYEKLAPWERRKWKGRFLTYGRQTLIALINGKMDPRQALFYSVRYYGTHLEQENAHPELFYELVSLGWLRAWEACEGTYDGFLSDLTRAWKRAEADLAQAQSAKDRGRAIGLQCRYALIVASINNLIGNINPVLLIALVDKKIWVPGQGLSYARRIPNVRQRVEVLVALLPQLPESLQITALQEALVAAQAIKGEDARVLALATLIPHLPEPLLQEVLAAIQMMNESNKVRLLATLIPHLPEPLLQEVLAAIQMMNESNKVRLLATLIPHLPESSLQEVLAAIQMMNESNKVRLLATLIPHLPESLLQEVLAAAGVIWDEWYREWVLVALAPHLAKPLLRRALVAARAFEDKLHQVKVLVALAPRLSKSLRRSVLQEALKATQAIENESFRIRGLIVLAPHLPKSLQRSVLQEALKATQAIESEGDQAEALAELAPHLSEPLLQEALVTTQTIKNEWRRKWALEALVPHLSRPLLQEALVATQVLEDENFRTTVLKTLAPHLSEPLLQEALKVVQALMDERDRTETLIALAPHLSEPLLQEALTDALVIKDEHDRTRVLKALAPHLPEFLLRKTLAAAWALENKHFRAKMLEVLAPHLSGPLLQEALADARAIKDEHDQARLLAALYPYLSGPLLQEALADVRAIKDEHDQADALEALAPHLSESLLQEALAIVRFFADKRTWTRLLATLVGQLAIE